MIVLSKIRLINLVLTKPILHDFSGVVKSCCGVSAKVYMFKIDQTTVTSLIDALLIALIRNVNLNH